MALSANNPDLVMIWWAWVSVYSSRAVNMDRTVPILIVMEQHVTQYDSVNH